MTKEGDRHSMSETSGADRLPGTAKPMAKPTTPFVGGVPVGEGISTKAGAVVTPVRNLVPPEIAELSSAARREHRAAVKRAFGDGIDPDSDIPVDVALTLLKKNNTVNKPKTETVAPGTPKTKTLRDDGDLPPPIARGLFQRKPLTEEEMGYLKAAILVKPKTEPPPKRTSSLATNTKVTLENKGNPTTDKLFVPVGLQSNASNEVLDHVKSLVAKHPGHVQDPEFMKKIERYADSFAHNDSRFGVVIAAIHQLHGIAETNEQTVATRVNAGDGNGAKASPNIVPEGSRRIGMPPQDGRKL